MKHLTYSKTSISETNQTHCADAERSPRPTGLHKAPHMPTICLSLSYFG